MGVRKKKGVVVRIERLQVEGGFLNGLDLNFTPDLNVLIGGRGVGKTAVIELIRFCLAVENMDAELQRDSIDHALGVLDDGVATLTVWDGESKTYSRSATSPSLEEERLSALPLILSQREVETLGRNARGRLQLIDSFLKFSGGSKVSRAEIRSLCVEIRDLCGEIDELSEQLELLPSVEGELQNVRRVQSGLASHSNSSTAQIDKSNSLQKEVNKFSFIDHSLAQSREKLLRWTESLPRNTKALVDLDEWPLPDDPLQQIRKSLMEDANTVSLLAERAKNYVAQIDLLRAENSAKKTEVEEELRKIRQKLEEEQAGAGRLAREISRLEDSLARLKSLEKQRALKLVRVMSAQSDRMHLLAKVEGYRSSLYERRCEVAAKLNQSLLPRVKVEVRHLADVSEYESAILDCLRGSYLRYSEIAPVIAREVSPKELCEIVFGKETKRLASVLHITEERAARLIAAFREGRIEDVLLARIGDEVEFYLLDCTTYKHIDELSIGQRCTVVLSVVLENENVVLVVDQPEDHLDNEFVVDTLIKAIASRDMVAQTIVSTHNANIPVLGDASSVVQLDSNGQRGFVKCAGSLTDPGVVQAILTVMEGGGEAFARRASFYEGDE